MVSARSGAVYSRARREAIHYPQGGAMSREKLMLLPLPGEQTCHPGGRKTVAHAVICTERLRLCYRLPRQRDRRPALFLAAEQATCGRKRGPKAARRG